MTTEAKELIMYGRSYPCPDQMRTERFLKGRNIPYRLILIDKDEQAGELVERYVGHRSVPTMVVAPAGGLEPLDEPTPVPTGRSSRSFDRGTLITEPSDEAMQTFLTRHGLLD
jgi:glutaredoxin